MSTSKTVAERFWEKVNKTKSCWFWTSAVVNGYGSFTANGKNNVAHRVSYKMIKGPIPEGKHLDHLCRNKLCVNPDHLEAVTCQENILRGIGAAAINSRKTHCVRGHEFNEENSYKNEKGQRICRLCKVLAARVYKKKYPERCKRIYDPEKRRAEYLRNRDSACKFGHEFTEKNTRIAEDGRRICKACLAGWSKKLLKAKLEKPKKIPTHCKKGHKANFREVKGGSLACKDCGTARMREWRMRRKNGNHSQ